MESMPQNPNDTTSPGAGYRLVGRFLEACDCNAICPCWVDEVPDDDECTGLFVWDITAGEALGHDVAGLRVASVSFHQGRRRGSRQNVVLLVDERAADHQRDALVDVFTGRSGGPLAGLAEMLGALVAQRSAKIDLTWDGESATVDIEGAVATASTPKLGPSGRATTLVDPPVADVFGTPAVVGVSDRFRVELPELEASIDVTGRSANVGWFSYTG
ncbi:MAG TPA: DUF1326 domain-containing protein [Acidimicrobiales bacterium]|nr:DUF1326 domain-containing protein [Acidimicrobiales bacterium]